MLDAVMKRASRHLPAQPIEVAQPHEAPALGISITSESDTSAAAGAEPPCAGPSVGTPQRSNASVNGVIKRI